MKGPPSDAILRGLQGLFLDCDGVLTDGRLPYSEEGRRTLNFHARDGFGLAMLARTEVKIAVISGRGADIAEKRHRELGVEHFIGRSHNKFKAVGELCDELAIDPRRVAFVGDDLPDLRAFAACGLKIAVADAAPEVVEAADWLLQTPGGGGAVREVCETLLKARGDWQKTLARLISNPS